MDQHKKFGLAIVGGGRGGLKLLRLLHQENGVEVLGVLPINVRRLLPSAISKRADRWN